MARRPCAWILVRARIPLQEPIPAARALLVPSWQRPPCREVPALSEKSQRRYQVRRIIAASLALALILAGAVAAFFSSPAPAPAPNRASAQVEVVANSPAGNPG